MHISAKQNSNTKSCFQVGYRRLYFLTFLFFFFSLFFQFDELLRDCIREIHSAHNETECGAAAKGADADVHFVRTFSKRGPRSGPQTAAQSGTDTWPRSGSLLAQIRQTSHSFILWSLKKTVICSNDSGTKFTHMLSQSVCLSPCCAVWYCTL